jgi:hypothetical protein
MRSAQRVGDANLGAISESMVEGGDKVRDVDRVVGRHAAAGEHRRIDAVPAAELCLSPGTVNPEMAYE